LRVDAVTAIVDHILSAPTWTVLGLVGLIVFVEDALFVGFVVPGETAAVLGGVAASFGHVPLWAVIVVVIAAAIIGDSVGYEVGRHIGPRILSLKILDKRRKRLDDAQAFLARRGGAAVLLGRWTAFFRAVMPALAGTVRMPYPKFLAFNAVGGVIWGAVVVTAGFLAGRSYVQVEKTMGRVTAVVLAVVVVAVVAGWQIRKRRSAASL